MPKGHGTFRVVAEQPRVVDSGVVGQKVPMAGLMKLRKPLKSRVLVEEIPVTVVHDDLLLLRIDRGQDHLTRALFDLTPEKIELEDMFDEVIYRNRRPNNAVERLRQLGQAILSTRFDLLVPPEPHFFSFLDFKSSNS